MVGARAGRRRADVLAPARAPRPTGRPAASAGRRSCSSRPHQGELVVVSAHKVVGDVAQAGLLRMIGTIAVILPAVALIQVLANAHDYRQPAAVLAVWLAVLGTTCWLTPRMRARVLSAAETAAANPIPIGPRNRGGAGRGGARRPGHAGER